MQRAAFALLVLLALPSTARPAAEITRYVLGNGAIGADAVGHRIRATLGQSIVGHSTGSQLEIFAGFWIPAGMVTAVGDDSSPPVSYALNEAFPNPFNPQTIIRYTVAAGGGKVRIRVFDLRGRLVQTLVDRSESPGNKSVVWRGRDHHDRHVAAGIYFVSMEAPGFVASRKIALLK